MLKASAIVVSVSTRERTYGTSLKGEHRCCSLPRWLEVTRNRNG